MKKYEYNLWQPYQFEEVQEHLERRAEEGWLLERVGVYCLIYRREEPRKCRYELTFHPKTGNYDPFPSGEHLDYGDYCKQAGWEYVSEWLGLPQVELYRSEAPDPVPIQTDDRVKWSVLGDWMEQDYVPRMETGAVLMGVTAIFSLLILLAVLSSLAIPDGKFWLGVLLAALFAVLVLEAFSVLYFCRSWLEQARLAANGEGEGPSGRRSLWLRGLAWVRNTMICVLLALVVFSGSSVGTGAGRLLWLVLDWVIFFLAAMALVFRLQDWLRRRRVPPGLTMAAVWAAIAVLWLINCL